jgi:hypothetical protein
VSPLRAQRASHDEQRASLQEIRHIDSERRSDPSAELSEDELAKVGGGIGSQSSGAGAGKVTFNPFSITRKIDKTSP